MKFILSKISREKKDNAKRKLAIMKTVFYKILSISPSISKLYFLFTRKFDLEMFHIVNGISNHGVDQFNVGRFRRNIHRLEKGLVMQPRRPVFALGYIQVILDDFAIIPTDQQGEIEWAISVLDEYFEVCETQQVASFKEQYEKIKLKTVNASVAVNETLEKKPFQMERFDSEFGFEELKLLCQSRKSVRWFEQKPVSLKTLNQAIEIAKTAPSACNRQPFYYKYTSDQEKIKALGGLALGTSGFLHNIPNLMCVVGNLHNYEDERDRHVIYIDASLATMQLLLAFETLGISSCILNWPEQYKQDKTASSILGLQNGERIIFLIAYGYGDTKSLVPYSAKKDNVDLIKEI